jgi:enoyl-CoA hydratase/carnithine racemase
MVLQTLEMAKTFSNEWSHFPKPIIAAIHVGRSLGGGSSLQWPGQYPSWSLVSQN